MLRVYQKNWDNGVPAPFLEYALSADWADQTFAHRDAIWEDDGRMVAFCFYESRPGSAFFNLDPAYSCLAGEMMDHAEAQLCGEDGKVKLKLMEGQTALIAEAKARGYRMTDTYNERIFDLSKPLDYALPEGYRFVDSMEIDMGKVLLCCWKGFDHEAEGEWDGRVDPGLRTALAPNATPQYYVVVEHIATGEYVCYSGMWWTPEDHLAYMEPLCTVPQHRRKGLAAAALSEMARRMRPLGAQWMTGGGDEFYTRIGFEKGIQWTTYEK
ncbi:MAG: GNAT family N-acetyltransferase [Eubacteriales bacterium]|nr:GNAT family N-acetyltransferase [Eubacteriales bacterium]